MSDLLSIHQAHEKILPIIQNGKMELCRVEHCLHRVLAKEIKSPFKLPPFDNSSMDGFAVRSKEIQNASPTSPISLPLSMDIPAGYTAPHALARGTAARILTGAPLPVGADAVIPLENSDHFQNPHSEPMAGQVTFFKSAAPGDFIRRAGEDIQTGQKVLEKGRRLLPQDIGLLVSLGIREIQVVKKPRVALFSSGDELLNPDQPVAPGKIYDANAFVLASLFEEAGAEVIHLGIAADDPVSVKNILEQALHYSPDLIVSSAGVSVGAYDFVKKAIEVDGSLSFWRVNMRPGKPFAFGKYHGVPFFGLPGNPVSAYVVALVFVLPVLRKLLGLPPFTQPTLQAVLEEPLASPDGRESFFRGIVRNESGIYKARLTTGHQGSGNLLSLVQANALLIVPAGVKHISAGETISVWPFGQVLN